MNKNIMVLLTLAIAGVVAAGIANAHMFGFGQTEEQREAIQTAVEGNDYDAWKAAMESQLTEENFKQQVAAHSKRAEMVANMESMRSAIEAGDYDAYTEAAQSMSQPLSEDDFAQLVEIHKAVEAGDYDLARQLRNEIGPVQGLGMGGFRHHGMGFGFGRQ